MVTRLFGEEEENWLPSDRRNTKTICTNLKIHLAGKDYPLPSDVNEKQQRHSHLQSASPGHLLKLPVLNDIGQTSSTGHPVIWLFFFCHLTLSTQKGPCDIFIPLAKVEILKYEMRRWKPIKVTVKISKESGQDERSDRTWNLSKALVAWQIHFIHICNPVSHLISLILMSNLQS